MIKEIKVKNGVRYTKDNRFISKDKLTIAELASIHEQPAPTEKVCLFCGIPAKLTRFVNMQTVVLCDEHYQDKNIGQIAQHLREIG